MRRYSIWPLRAIVSRRGNARAAGLIMLTRPDAKADLFDDIEVFYNQRRRHSLSGWTSDQAGVSHTHAEEPLVKPLRRGLRKILDGVRVRWTALKAGSWPYPIFYARRYWQTRNPTTYRQKLHYKMVRDRRPILRVWADKVAVRKYVADRMGEQYLTQAYAVVSDPAQIDWRTLPRQYVCKPAHSWGRVIVVHERADPSVTLPGWATDGGPAYHILHPDRVNPDQLAKVLSAWLREAHGWGPGSEWEWCYRGIPRRILVEELLEGEDGQLPDDLKCHVYNGRAQNMGYMRRWRDGKLIKREAVTLAPDWTKMPWSFVSDRVELAAYPRRPDNLNEIVRCAETLAGDTDYMRVDLYVLGHRIVVGELTNYPSAGRTTVNPELDRYLGARWAVPREYR